MKRARVGSPKGGRSRRPELPHTSVSEKHRRHRTTHTPEKQAGASRPNQRGRNEKEEEEKKATTRRMEEGMSMETSGAGGLGAGCPRRGRGTEVRERKEVRETRVPENKNTSSIRCQPSTRDETLRYV